MRLHVGVVLDGQDAEKQGHCSPLGSAQSTSGQAEEGAHHTQGWRWRCCWRRWPPPQDCIFTTKHSYVFVKHPFVSCFFLVLGFDVAKTGDARIGFVGFPSVGKSTLLSNLAGVYSEVAAYEFTTLTTVPGVVRYKGAKIQVGECGFFNQAHSKRLWLAGHLTLICFFVVSFWIFQELLREPKMARVEADRSSQVKHLMSKNKTRSPYKILLK